MLGWLESIACWLSNLALGVAWAVTTVINLLVAAIGALLAVLLVLLPDMPAFPDPPSSGVLGWLNWAVPLGPMLAGLTTVLGLWLAILAIRVAARWVKLL